MLKYLMSLLPTRPSVLIVDDEPMVLITLKVILEREKLEVVTAHDPTQALLLAGQKQFAVIISDHKMPEMTGLDFLLACRRVSPDSSRILLTGALNLQSVMDVVSQGDVCQYVAKPWLREDLLSTVQEAVQRHQLMRAAPSLQGETA